MVTTCWKEDTSGNRVTTLRGSSRGRFRLQGRERRFFPESREIRVATFWGMEKPGETSTVVFAEIITEPG
jgi:hypothetical protein